MRPASSSRLSCHTISWVRPIANEGMSRTPFRRTASFTTSASVLIASPAGSCSRPP